MTNQKKYFLTLTAMVAFLVVSILLSVSVGSANIHPLDSAKVILARIPLVSSLVSTESIKPVYETIIWNVRLPRILLAGLVGGGLAVVGATFQGLFRNPLADPHILGVSSGAALGATLAMFTGISVNFLGLGIIGLFAFLGALMTVFVVYSLSSMQRSMAVTNILLIGTAISTLLSSIISLLMTFHREQIEKVYMWTLGSFSAATWAKVVFLAVLTLGGSLVTMLFARELNVILMGEEVAKSLGIDTTKVYKILIVFGSFVVAACVSVSGIIGFVGLIIPHAVRLLRGPNYRTLLLYSWLVGATFTIICDTVARTLVAPSEIPVGVITAIIGAPYFIMLLYIRNRETRVS